MPTGRLILEYRGMGHVTRIERDVKHDARSLHPIEREDLADVLAAAGNDLLRSAIPESENKN